MITLYRAVCEKEYNKTTSNYLSFDRNREKAFGTKSFVTNRVCDGEFNNSKFKDKYTHLIEISFDEKYKNKFHKWGDKEMLLMTRKSNFPYVVNKLGKIKKADI